MSLKHKFEFLELDDKMKLIFSGQFINSIDFENRTVSLYLVEKEYYVEVFSLEESKEIDFICLASNERLPLFIDIEKLMN
jgi:hypothetical protein